MTKFDEILDRADVSSYFEEYYLKKCGDLDALVAVRTSGGLANMNNYS